MSQFFEGLESLLAARVWDIRLRAEGVTLAQASMLDSLMDGPLPLGKLSDTERVSHAVMSGVVTRAERLKLVTRERADHDGRLVLVTITRKGERLLNQLSDLEVT